MKKLTSLLLALTMVLSLGIVNVAAAPNGQGGASTDSGYSLWLEELYLVTFGSYEFPDNGVLFIDQIPILDSNDSVVAYAEEFDYIITDEYNNLIIPGTSAVGEPILVDEWYIHGEIRIDVFFNGTWITGYSTVTWATVPPGR